MAPSDASTAALPDAIATTAEKLPDLLHLPPPASSNSVSEASLRRRSRLFNREKTVHQLLGGGKTADVILWREKYISAGILVSSTVAWILLEHSGYTLLSIISNVLLLLILTFFVWANAANFIHKSPPRILELHLSEDMVVNFASSLRLEINKALAVAHDIALGKDLKVFLKVVAVLWGLSTVGGWFHILTLIYICIVLSHTIPVIYERYEEQIDMHAKVAVDEALKHYQTMSNIVAKKISKIKTQ